jgi:group II intron reverse transcriptase/maturase
MKLRKQSFGEADVFLLTEGSMAATNRVSRVAVTLPESKSTARSHMSSAREPGDLDGAWQVMVTAEHPREGEGQEPGRRAMEESDALVVPKKSAKTRVTPVESMEGRGAAKEKLASGNARRIQGRESAPTQARRAGSGNKPRAKGGKYTNLFCHLKVAQLREAYFRLRQDASPGADRVTWAEYGQGLEARLRDLQDRLHRGSYHPRPVRRVMIPKPGGKERPLGIPSLEDKVVQQAVRAILEPIYEREFLGFSYGFRPGKSAHDALDALAATMVKGRVNWVLDADIRSFFDTIDHAWMKKFVEHRIGDKRLVRLLMKWLKAGVMVEGLREETVRGTPQGGIISPLLANIYLHYVLDLWVHAWRRRDARQEVYVVRYADDFVMGFEDGRDARSMLAALRRRLREFGLELHEDKTRVLRFGRYARERSAVRGEKPGTFDFLGFTHICGVDRKNGWFQLRRHTSKKKRQSTLRKLSDELRRRRHEPPEETCKWLGRVLRGFDQYFGVPSNETILERMRRHIQQAWVRQLQRRSQRARWTVPQLRRFNKRFPLPKVAIVHPWPDVRFAAR